MGAQIIKVEGYLVDIGSGCDVEELQRAVREILGSRFDMIAKNFTLETADIGEWDDGHELNRMDCPKETCEKYFNH